MATLAESFLLDLDDLQDEDEDEIGDGGQQGESSDPLGGGRGLGGGLNADDPEWLEPIVDAVEEFLSADADGGMGANVVVSGLTKEASFKDALSRVRQFMQSDPLRKTEDGGMDLSNGGEQGGASGLVDTSSSSSSSSSSSMMSGLASDEYELVEECTLLVNKIDVEVLSVHKFAKDVFGKRFPELEQIVYGPLEYVAIVKRIKNETNLTLVDLSDLLSNTVIMAVTVAASMTTGSPLSPQELDRVLRAAHEAEDLAACRAEILAFLESRIGLVAPNLSAILGSALAARLITQAGGLHELARMPAQNIMLLGGPRKNWSTAAGAPMGIICGCDIIQSTPQQYKSKAIRLVSGKCSLAARVDTFKESVHAEAGIVFRDQIVKSLLKAQDPPPAPQKKALPVPDEKPRAKRGGKRYRRMKQKYAMSELRKEAGKLKFGLDAEDEYGLESGEGFGMLGKSTGFGKIQLQAKQGQKLHLGKKRQQQLARGQGSATATSSKTTVGAGGSITTILA